MELLTQTTVGKFISTCLISMLPIVELRGGLPYGIACELPYMMALSAAVLGNLFPVPLIMIYIRSIFEWLRRYSFRLDRMVSKLERRAHLKGRLVTRYNVIGLCLLVAIPLPGTGAWTGALVAALLDIRLKRAIPAIIIGVWIAAAIMTAVTYGAKTAYF